MAHPKPVCALLFSILLLSASPVHASRVHVLQKHEVAETTEVASSWGRSCNSIQTRFQEQQLRLADMSPGSMRSMFASISILRTLRRANARNCSFVSDPDLDMSEVSQFAAASLRQSPCYEAATAAMAVAQNLPAEEREDAMGSAMVMLLSSTCTVESQEEPELSSPTEEQIEEEVDLETDQILDELSAQSGSALLQTNFIPFEVAFILGWIFWGVVIAVACGYLMMFIWRALKWLRCAMIHGGSACLEEEAPTWLRYILTGGSAALCVAGGAYGGGFTSFVTTIMASDVGLVSGGFAFR